MSMKAADFEPRWLEKQVDLAATRFKEMYPPLTPGEIKKVIERRLESHPGDAPWSCSLCYHNRPCYDREILTLALKGLELNKIQEKLEELLNEDYFKL